MSIYYAEICPSEAETPGLAGSTPQINRPSKTKGEYKSIETFKYFNK